MTPAQITEARRPVAWRFHAPGQEWYYAELHQGWADNSIEQQPLYTHPAPAVDVEALMANLPPIPAPFLRHWINAPFKDVGLHTDEAMRSYAAEAVRAALEGLNE